MKNEGMNEENKRLQGYPCAMWVYVPCSQWLSVCPLQGLNLQPSNYQVKVDVNTQASLRNFCWHYKQTVLNTSMVQRLTGANLVMTGKKKKTFTKKAVGEWLE